MAPALSMTNMGDIWLSRTFHYRPDVYGNGTQIVLFSLFTIAIFVLNIIFARRTGNPSRYMHLITCTGVMEVVGYGLRIHAAENLNLTSFIVTTVLLLIAPILLAAVNYIVIGKLLKGSEKSVGCVKPNYATRLFLLADILCFVIQCAAAGLLTSKDKASQDAGTAIVLIGLAFQTLFFTYFVGVALYVAYSEKFAMMKNDSLRPVLVGSFASIACLYLRNVFRFVEFASGRDSELNKLEVVFFMLETFPILVAFGIYCFYHFGRLLPSDADLPGVLAKGAAPKDPSMAGMEMQQV